MTYQHLAENKGINRLSFCIDADGDLDLLYETWQGDDYDFAASIGLTPVEFFTIKNCLLVDSSSVRMVLSIGDRQVRLTSTGDEVDLAMYFLREKNEPEFNGDLTISWATWTLIAPQLATALISSLAGGVA
jgi:hypothetical protein